MKVAKTLSVRPLKVSFGLAAVLLVSACGGSSGTASQASRPATGPGAAGATATSSAHPASTAPAQPPASTTATGATSVSTGPAPCRAADLSLTFLGGQGATGHGELGFALRNTSGRSCTTIGYPGVQFLDQAGRPLPTVPTHTTEDFFGAVPRAQLTVAPGALVSFRLGVTHGATSPIGCTTAYGLQVIPPNDRAALRATIRDGEYECRTTTVSPLARGTSAYS